MGHFGTILRSAFAAGTLAVVLLSLLPGKEIPAVGVSDKIEHVTAYALLGLAGGLAFPSCRAAMLLLALLPLLGIGLELAQSLVADRSSEVADAIADWVGATLTLLPILLFRLGSRRTR
ncbi:MAG: VanZ family protein [Rhodospirillales bacterium]|nr:VanZ family protein [Rhodospirillales bacterium]